MTTVGDECPLCGCFACAEFHRSRRRTYLQCPECSLAFVPPQQHLSPVEEKRQYDLHENDPGDDRYRRFLSRLANPLLQRLAPGACGLDFGSGPGPTLSLMLAEAGFPTRNYDRWYAPDDSVWDQQYDFITASEVFEHLHAPRFELRRLWSVLRGGGMLGVMTKRVRDAQAFASWHYISDPTHIAFYSEETFRWLGRQWCTEPEFIAADVVLFRKPLAAAAASAG